MPLTHTSYSPPLSLLFSFNVETKKPRDACVISKGEQLCAVEIEAHKQCLREDGFKVA